MAKRVHRRLSEREITAAKSPPKGKRPRRYADGGNLYLCVADSGAKHWTFIYKLPGQKPRQMGLGPLEHVDSKTARARAGEARELIFRGEDPMAAMGKRASKAKRLPAASKTFRQVAEDAITSYEAGWSNDKTPDQWRSSLKAHAYARIGDMPVQDIVANDVFEVLKPIWSARPETASRVRARIEKVLDFAGALNLRTGENPARWRGHLDHLLAKRSKVNRVKHHAALAYGEVGSFMIDLREREGTAPKALEFAVLTAARTGEVLGAAWSEFDLEQKVWVIPADRMKARREHRVPLSKPALDLLNKLPRDDSDLVFIGPTRGRPLSNMAMAAVLRRMGRDDITVHGFRSSFRDWAAEITRYPGDVVEMALAHAVSNAVEAAYRRGDLFEKRRRLMDAWASYCAKPSGKAGDNVTPIREAMGE